MRLPSNARQYMQQTRPFQLVTRFATDLKTADMQSIVARILATKGLVKNAQYGNKSRVIVAQRRRA
jgi:hypothetical protein